MLPLDDTRWGELEGGYRVPCDASVQRSHTSRALPLLGTSAILNDIDADEIRDYVEERLDSGQRSVRLNLDPPGVTSLPPRARISAAFL
jgi:hypothetical protein